MKRPEQALQRALVQYLTLCAPDDLFWTAINPVPAKSKAAAGISKAMGLRAGVADLLFIYEGQPLFLELKSGKGKESPAQLETSLLAAEAGTPTFISQSVEGAVALLQTWGVPLRGRMG